MTKIQRKLNIPENSQALQKLFLQLHFLNSSHQQRIAKHRNMEKRETKASCKTEPPKLFAEPSLWSNKNRR
ncbi:hypothetical protein QJS10_CPB11g02319 [Acorus calamus]|uniref:Uncharacterized protein n=1 Tax=Acorus calamus TaxID=4465 RepID=A0AAV9DN87_ACOCL|nr:hypothetical protein QJS10_CPB11g02319 [Acorus calamus]